MSDNSELLQDIHEQTIENGQRLNEVVNRLDQQRDELDAHDQQIQWSRDRLKKIGGRRELAGWIVGGLGTVAAIVSGLAAAGVL